MEDFPSDRPDRADRADRADRSDRPDRTGHGTALHAALAACAADRNSAAWAELAGVVTALAPTDPAVARLWPPDGTGAALRRLADELDRVRAQDGPAGAALTAWSRRHTPTRPAAPAATHNVIGGNSVLHGPSVQARDVYGGIHYHNRPEPPRPRRPVPRQLPPVTARFIGREHDRRALDELLGQGPGQESRVLAVTGLAGVGKTTLVAHWLHENTGRFPDGQLYADLSGHAVDEEHGPVAPGTVLEAFLVALGVSSPPAGTTRRGALWRSLTADLRLAVLLDNAFTSAQVRPLLLGAPAGLTVVTSRNSLTGLRADGAAVHRLDGLPVESAVELLTVGGGTRVAREPVAAREVVRLCGRVPLAVGLASAQLAVRPHRSVSALAESLRRGPGGAADVLRADGEAVLRRALDLSYDLLPGPGAALYRRMGLLPADRYDLFTLAAVAGAAPTPGGADTTDLAVQTLVEANLLEETGPDTYRLHDLVQPHARRLGAEREDPDGRERTLRRYVDWCLATTAAAEAILTPAHRLPGHDIVVDGVAPTPLAGPDAALTWLDTHRHGIMGAVRHCSRAGWHTACWRLADVAWPLFQRHRPTDLWVEAHRLGLEAARHDGSAAGRDRMLTSGAMGLRAAGRYAEAADWYREALGAAVADGDVRQQAQAVNGLGHLALLARRFDEARAHFEHALRLRESIGYRRGAALTRRRLGETALETGDFVSAAGHLAWAAEELAALDETYEETRVRALLGHVLVRDGEHGEGVSLLERALRGFREGDARSGHWEARCLEWLGLAAEGRGEGTEAAEHYRAALALFRQLDPEDARRLDGRLRDL
ncbi:tetratricopeptide repeat protein [Streptomyces sp. NPDC026672]|uniref:ATP-binding protein n=1 Tax=unclassified Streptomyces TaxID=2593676 RepID=UPI0033FF8E85